MFAWKIQTFVIAASLGVHLLISNVAIAQTSFLPRELDANKKALQSPPDEMRLIPEDSKKRFKPGEAPFHIKLKFYAQYLETAISNDRLPSMDEEAKELGLDVSALDQLNHLLGQYANQESKAAQKALVVECAPILKKLEMSGDMAKAAIARLDDRDLIGGALAKKLLEDVGNQFGNDAMLATQSRIIEFGNSLMFTRVDMVKFIQSLGGDYQSYLNQQCSSL
jgi:hypothetical protein